ncbi:MAG TPA: histidine kinase [Chitinophagaceae bacterium]|nr:histidine kinase [Chitinophagaceae bacterium]
MKKIFAISIFFVACQCLLSQTNPTFYTLNTSNGLSYIGVSDICVDKKGNLWVGTGNGLNVFNGRTTEKYFASEYPQLENSNILWVSCDKNDRIWIITAGGHVTMLDEKRKLHKIALVRDNKPVKTFSFLQTPDGSVYLYAEKGLYQYSGKMELQKLDSVDNSQFNFIPLQGYDKYRYLGFNAGFAFDENYYLMVFKDAILKVSYKENKVEQLLNIPNAHALSRWQKDELLYYDVGEWKLKVVNIVTMKFSYPLAEVRDQFGKKITVPINEAKSITPRQYLLTSQNEGIYIWDTSSKKISNYRHSVADPTSINNNTQSYIAVGQKGWVFMICNPAGINYFNNNAYIGSQNVFLDNKGNGYDNYISGIATKDNNTFYLGTDNSLFRWNRSTNTAIFSDLKDETGQPIFRNKEVVSILLDKKDRVWSSTIDNGIVITDRDLKLVKHITNADNNDPKIVGIKNPRRIALSPSGDVWVCGVFGICKIDPETFVVDTFANTPLQQFKNKNCVRMHFTDEYNLWFAVFNVGLFHYNFLTKQLDSIKKENGLTSLATFDINSDKSGNIYIASIAGLDIISPTGKIKTLTKTDGLLIDRAEALLLDKYNRMWIGNDIGFACYDPVDGSLKTFDERYGLSIYGFRVGSYFQLSNGEFIMGTPKGIQYFHPDSLYNKKISLNVLINKIETKNINSNIIDNAEFKLQARDNQITFYFNSIDFTPHLRTYYEYKLVDLDKDWIKVADQNSVRYNSLPPGQYVFKVRVSNDNKNWQESDNAVTVIIAAPFYQTWWFKLLGIIIGFLLIWYVIKYYQRKQQKKHEELEIESVINYFASQINRHQHTDDMLWDIAKNCISKMNFEDCVIYLKDEQRNVLMQKAAWGPKMQRDLTIYNPIEIEVGKGIVGAVAQTGKPELIANTELDKRYIADDAKRMSELAVPIIVDNKVIGVIDSEHTQKNFFKQKHLNILTTITVLCAAQIQRVKAEEEKQQAKFEIIENKQKVTESRLQSLRLQMNPHFLFNALNSIQQMILANEEMIATKYLSKFSKLLRAILVHSDKEYVSLKEELEILNLYIDLESIRFKDSFKYTIECDEDIDTDEIKLPTLLIQPFVENAIWHGLMHKEGKRMLQVKFSELGECIHCIIEDNGIGREKSREAKLATGQGKKHTSKGIQVSMERLEAMGNGNQCKGSLEITDLKDEQGNAKGTRIKIVFPTQNN